MTTKVEKILRRIETRLQKLEEQEDRVWRYLDLLDQIELDHKRVSEEFGVPNPHLLLRSITLVPESIGHFALESLPYSPEEISYLSNFEGIKEERGRFYSTKRGGGVNEDEIRKTVDSIMEQIDQIPRNYGVEPPQTEEKLNEIRDSLYKEINELRRIYSK